MQLTPEEERAGLAFLFRLSDLSRGNPGAQNDLTVTMRGVIVKKAWPLIYRRSDGVYVGNAFGPAGGYAAVFVIKEILSGL